MDSAKHSSTICGHYGTDGESRISNCFAVLWTDSRSSEMKDFIEGFMKGAKETPRGFFAPAVALWYLLIGTTESLVGNRPTNSEN